MFSLGLDLFARWKVKQNETPTTRTKKHNGDWNKSKIDHMANIEKYQSRLNRCSLSFEFIKSVLELQWVP